MRHPARRIPIFGLGIALLAHPTHAIAGSDDVAQAVKELVAQGSAEYTKQHWEAARVAFLKAWQLKQHYAIAGSLAGVEMKLGRHREAAEHLKYALANLPPEHPEKRAEAEASLKECRAHLSAVRVFVSGGILVLVTLDGRALPFQDLGDELLLDPGPHKFEVTQQGYQPLSRDFTATAGETREFRFDLVPLPQPAGAGSLAASHAVAVVPNAHALDANATAHYSPRTWALIGGSAATVIAAGMGTYFTLRYFALKRDSETALAHVQAEGSPELVASHAECQPGAPIRPAACDQLSNSLDSRNTAGQISNATLITAGALGVATVATWLLWPRADGPAEKHAHLSVSPWLLGARGAALQGDF
jgi:hypothetical protein